MTLWKSHNTPPDLFIRKKTLASREKTTQSDPFATAMFGTAIFPLMKWAAVPGVKHKWHADGGNAVDSINDFLVILKLLKHHGLSYSYHITQGDLISKSELIGVLWHLPEVPELKNWAKWHPEKIASHSNTFSQSMYKGPTSAIERKVTFYRKPRLTVN